MGGDGLGDVLAGLGAQLGEGQREGRRLVHHGSGVVQNTVPSACWRRIPDPLATAPISASPPRSSLAPTVAPSAFTLSVTVWAGWSRSSRSPSAVPGESVFSR